ncbi:hypothetical protein QOZ91_000788 [Clostridium sardiniense]|nr:hypothetical protein [Clostridium sardiniense]
MKVCNTFSSKSGCSLQRLQQSQLCLVWSLSC